MSDVSRLMRKHVDQRAKVLGLTRAQWQVLAHLFRHEGINQSGLAEILEIENITLGRHIDRLQDAGWVERRHDPADRRAWRLYLTNHTHPSFDSMQELIDDAVETAFAGFSSEERERLIDTLSAIKGNLSEKESAAPVETAI